MNFVKEIKKSFQLWTAAERNKSVSLTSEMCPGPPPPEKILICRPNHRLGNLLLVTPLLQEISETFPKCKIDLFVKGELPPIVFKYYRNVERIIQLPRRPLKNFLDYFSSWLSIWKKRYDLVIDVDKNSSGGKLSTRFAISKHKISGHINTVLELRYDDYHHHAKYPVYNFRNWLAEQGYKESDKPVPAVNIKLSALEIAEGYKILRQLVNNSNQTICLFTYATGQKCHPETWWENFYEGVKRELPAVNFVEVLPIHNVSRLSYKVPTFYSRNVREIASLIANADLFIGGDSGIMHLASAARTPTIGLFSVTDENLYAPYDNNSVAIDTNTSSAEDCIKVVRGILSENKLASETV